MTSNFYFAGKWLAVTRLEVTPHSLKVRYIPVCLYIRKHIGCTRQRCRAALLVYAIFISVQFCFALLTGTQIRIFIYTTINLRISVILIQF